MAKKEPKQPRSGGIKGFFTNAYKSFSEGGGVAKDWSLWAAGTAAKVGFIIATTSMVVFMPLLFEIGREGQVNISLILLSQKHAVQPRVVPVELKVTNTYFTSC